MDRRFKVGDVVRLTAGGPQMTVVELHHSTFVDEHTVWCVWYSNDGRLARDQFPDAALLAVNPQASELKMTAGAPVKK